MFRAILVEKSEAGQSAHVTELEESALPAGDVLVRVERSTINYKDALAITGKAPVIRKFPMVPGIDGAGVVLEATFTSIRDMIAHTAWSFLPVGLILDQEFDTLSKIAASVLGVNKFLHANGLNLGMLLVFAGIMGYQRVGAAATISVLVASQLLARLAGEAAQAIIIATLAGATLGAVMESWKSAPTSC